MKIDRLSVDLQVEAEDAGHLLADAGEVDGLHAERVTDVDVHLHSDFGQTPDAGFGQDAARQQHLFDPFLKSLVVPIADDAEAHVASTISASHSSKSASIFAAQMKSFSDNPLIAWVEYFTRQLS